MLLKIAIKRDKIKYKCIKLFFAQRGRMRSLRMRKKDKVEYSDIFIMIVIIGTMLMPFGNVTFLFACTMIWMIVRSVNLIRGRETVRRKYYKTDLLVFLLLGYEILHMIGQIFVADDETVIDFSHHLLLISLSLLYFLCVEIKRFRGIWLDSIVYSGLIVMSFLLYRYTCGIAVKSLIGDMFENTAQIASYLLLVSMVSVLQYCRCHNGMQKYFYGLSAGLGFFLLLVNHNRVSLWFMMFFFLMIPICIRPTAELIQRDMQMFLLYALLLCNMSLLCNYTSILIVETSYDLEQSVYLELILSVGALIFLHYWDRIPKGIPMERIVLRRLYRKFRFVVTAMICLFIFIILSSHEWSVLADNQKLGFIEKLAVPLSQELAQESSFLYIGMIKQGLPFVMIVLFILVSIIFKMRKNIGWDKLLTNGLFLIVMFGIAQSFFWNSSIRVLPAYTILVAGTMAFQEERSHFVGIRIKDYQQFIEQIRQ